MSVLAFLIGLAMVLTIQPAIAGNLGEKAAGEKGDAVEDHKPERGCNRLMLEKSPYLRQHAENPVNWYPWGPEAFEKAHRENKPIFLSIGYSTCHWCHVMAHESFEDPEVARLMNDVFVSVKVDREERPDIDNIYMTVCQMMTGRGGWPLTIVMTPDKKPFFAGTYFPKQGLFGRIGMMDLVPRIKEVWAVRHDEVLDSADKVTAALRQASFHGQGEDLGKSTLTLAYEQLVEQYDEQNGGFGSAPKFPTPHNLLFLLRYWNRTGRDKALEMVESTLQAMRRGGIYDHVGRGFHRYSTDSSWLVPHFEKMLYDQAMLAMAYTEAYLATGKTMYRKTAEEIFTYVLRDMTASSGGFFSGEDADSEGEEGKFYAWTEREIREALSAEEADLAIQAFNIEEGGNFSEESTGKKTGMNILHMGKDAGSIAADAKMTASELTRTLEAVVEKLSIRRNDRVRPHRDDKILTDWNGLMIAALAKGAQAFDEPRYAEAAERAMNFVLQSMRTSDGRLFHRYRDGEAALAAHLDDYAFLIWGLIELYEATFETRYLDTALRLNDEVIQHFWDGDAGGFYFTADYAEKLLVRKKEFHDGAIPSGNSVAAYNLLRLGHLTGNADLEERAAKMGRAFSPLVNQSPLAYTQFLVALDFALGPSYEVVIAGNSKATDTEAMLRTIRSQFVPNKVVILRPTEEGAPEIIHLATYTEPQLSIDDKATAYVCLDYQCKIPTTDIREMLQMFHGPKP